MSTACSAPDPTFVVPPAAQASVAPDAAAPLTFVNRVWRVAESSAGSPGQLYVFLSEGTLVMASATTTATLGTWRREGEGLVMVEEGLPYTVDIVSLTGAEFRIRSHNPGTPVEIRLVPATGEERTRPATH
jgi:hypothetical protein